MQELPKARDSTGFEHGLYFLHSSQGGSWKTPGLVRSRLFRNFREKLALVRFSSKFAGVRG